VVEDVIRLAAQGEPCLLRKRERLGQRQILINKWRPFERVDRVTPEDTVGRQQKRAAKPSRVPLRAILSRTLERIAAALIR
jgi:hypothetical protein